jgi:hypothetical protein
MRLISLALPIALAAGCTKTPATTPSSQPPAVEQAPAGGARPQLTPDACQAQGGKVVGDIGDGAVHRPEYRCPDSGAPPIGTIAAEPGAPVAIEGSVCCK